MFGGADEDGMAGREGGNAKISQLYSLVAASEGEESDSSHREGKRRDRADSGSSRRKSSRSPEREKRDRRTESRDRSRDRWKAGRRDSDSKRRCSVEENHTRKLSSSSAEVDQSRKSGIPFEYSGGRNRIRHDSSTRSSFDGGRYESKEETERERGRARRRAEEERTSEPEPEGTREQNGQGGGRSGKSLPSNLLDIFNQIAQFEKEKEVKPNK